MKPILCSALGVASFLMTLFPTQTAWTTENTEEPTQITSLLAMSLEELMNLEVELATGTSKPINLTPAVATVITAEDIKRMGATTLDEVLETVPGLHVVPSSTALNTAIHSIRGIHTQLNPQVLLLLDNIPIASPVHGAKALVMRIPVAKISRVEIIRGPGSAVHGADAFAGTINIITHDSFEQPGTASGVRAGSFDTYDAWLNHGNIYQGWQLATTIEYQQTRGDSDRIVDRDTQSFFDNLFGTSASNAPASLDTDYKLLDTFLSLNKDNVHLNLWGMWQYDSGAGPGVANALTENNDLDSNELMANLQYTRDDLVKDLRFRAICFYLYQQYDPFYEIFPAGALLPVGTDGNIGTRPTAGLVLFKDGVYGNPMTKNHTVSLELESISDQFDDHTIRFSFGGRQQWMKTEQYKNNGPGVLDSANTSLAPPPAINIRDRELTDVTGTEYMWLDDHDRTVLFGSLQDEWTLADDWILTGGVRYDHYSDFGSTINPRIALVWETRYDLTTKLMYGSAFRPPSFSELYAENNPSTIGNRDLEPETIDVYELAFDYQPKNNLRLTLNLFHYDIDGLIEYVPNPPPKTFASAQNKTDQEGNGFEVELDWLPLDSLRIRSNLAYQRSKDKDTGEIVPDAPELQFYANAHWTFLPDWSLDGQFFWIGNRHRTAGDLRKEIKDNEIVNLTLRRTNLPGNLEMALAVRNLFDEEVREPGPATIPNDYPMESRALWVELRYLF